MKRYDAVVIGGTRAGAIAADVLAAAGRSVALIRSAGDEDADRLISILDETPDAVPAADRCEVLDGPARFLSRHSLAVGTEEIEADRIIIAVGATLVAEWDLGPGPFPPLLEALTGPVPARSAVLGTSPAAVAAAFRLASRGSHVTLIGRAARLLPLEDDAIAEAVTSRLGLAGVTVSLSATALTWAPSGNLRWTVNGEPQEAATDRIFPATEFRAATETMHLDAARIFADVNGRIVTDEEMSTSAPGVWAIGHATQPGAPLAETLHQAQLAAHNALSGFLGRRKTEPALPPAVIRTSPPAARVGLTESEARARYKDVAVATVMDANGLVKVIARRGGGRLLGAHVIGPAAPEVIIFFDLVLRAEIGVEDIPERRHFPAAGGSDMVYRALRAWSAAANGN